MQFLFNPVSLSLRFFAGSYLGVELCGFPEWDCQRVPIRSGKVLGEIDDLSHVISGMRNVAINGLHDRVRFPANKNRAGEIGIRNRREPLEQTLPARFP